MLFASTQLAARIERAESGLVAAGGEAARRLRRDEPILVRPIAGGVAAWAGAGSPLNKVAGLGFEPLDPVELEALELELERRGSPVQVELSTLADPSLGPLLCARGYVLRGFENVLGRALPAPPPARASTEITVEACAPEAAADWLEVVVDGFACPDTQGVASHEEFPRAVLEQVIGALSATPGFTRYLARRAGEAAGGASLRIAEGVAQLAGSATLPAHRRRGVQSALLARRLADAAQAGCDVAVVTTSPGSKSQENVQRLGFELLYARAVFVRGEPA